MQLPLDRVAEKIDRHIETTSKEYYKPAPAIAYSDPLCRFGYLYMNVVVNATVFEKTVMSSVDLKAKIKETGEGTLNVCSLGGGPGTELLGLSKYLLHRTSDTPPTKIVFNVIDNIHEWTETWHLMADAVEADFQSGMKGPVIPIIAPTFLHFDVLDHDSYKNYSSYFRRADIIVLNYLLSENKTRLDDTVRNTLNYLSASISDDCTILVIDRLENDGRFQRDVTDVLQSVFGDGVVTHPMAGRLDRDEDMKVLKGLLGFKLERTPRENFRTPLMRNPTVFWFGWNRNKGVLL